MSRSLKNQVTKKVFYKAESQVCRCLGEKIPDFQLPSVSNNFRLDPKRIPRHLFNRVWINIDTNVKNKLLVEEAKNQLRRYVKNRFA